MNAQDVTHVAFRAALVKHTSMADNGLRLVLDIGEQDVSVVLRAIAAGWMMGEYELAVVITPIQGGQL